MHRQMRVVLWWMVVVVVGGSIQHSSRQATAMRTDSRIERGREQAEQRSFSFCNKLNMNVRPTILHWYRQFDAGVFWLPANDCDCLGSAGFAKLSLLWTVGTSTAGDCNRKQRFS
jgi:hypothetical protein